MALWWRWDGTARRVQAASGVLSTTPGAPTAVTAAEVTGGQLCRGRHRAMMATPRSPVTRPPPRPVGRAALPLVPVHHHRPEERGDLHGDGHRRQPVGNGTGQHPE